MAPRWPDVFSPRVWSRVLAGWLAGCLLLGMGPVRVAGAHGGSPSTPATSSPSGPFPDVPANFWDAGRIQKAVRMGWLTPYPDGLFHPTWAFTQGELAQDLDRVLGKAGVGEVAVAKAVAASGASYQPQAAVTHAQFALAVAWAMGLGTAAQDLTALPVPWPDARFIPSWARGASTLFARLGLSWGNTWAGTFQAGGGVERDQAAFALVGLATLPPDAVAQAVAPAVRSLVVQGLLAHMAPGQSVSLTWQAIDAQGHPLPVPVTVKVAGPGRWSPQVHTLTALAPGTVQVRAQAQGTAVSFIAQVTVTGSSQGSGQGPSGGHTGTGTHPSRPLWDLPSSSWAYPAMAALAAKGALALGPDGAARPWDVFTQDDLWLVLVHAFSQTPQQAQEEVQAATGALKPLPRPVHLSQLAFALAQALGWRTLVLDEAAGGEPGPSSRLEGAVALLAALELAVQPGEVVSVARSQKVLSRAQAAYLTWATLHVAPSLLARVAASWVRDIRLSAPASLTAGQPVAISAQAVDGRGRVLPVPVVLSAQGAQVEPGGELLASSPGTVVLTLKAGSVRQVRRLPVLPPAPTALSLSLPTGAIAQQAVPVTVQVMAASQADPYDHGRTVTLTWTGPTGSGQVQGKDHHGVAILSFTPPAQGTYTLVATSSGLASAAAVLAVGGPPPAALAMTVAPSPAEEGAQVTVRAQVLLSSGQVDTQDQGRTLTLEVTGAGAPPGPLTAQDDQGVATFAFTPTAPGQESLTLTAPGLSPAHATLTVSPAPPAGIVLTAPTTTLAPGQSVPITATVVDSAGQPTLATLPIQVGLGAQSVGSLSQQATTLDSQGVVAVYTAPASVPASEGAAIVVTSPGLPPASLTLTVNPQPPGPLSLSFPDAPFTSAAGAALTVAVDVTTSGAVDAAASGLTVTLTVKGPAGTQTLEASTTQGEAAFSLTEKVAGTYTLSAQAQGARPATATWNVVAAPPARLSLSVAPSTLLVPRQTATLTVSVTDAYGNPVPQTSLPPVSFSVQPQGAGQVGAVATSGSTVTARFTASNRTGSATVTVSAPGLAPATLHLQVAASRSALVSGKGMWLMYSDWRSHPVQQIVATCLADHLTHLYLEVATTHDGFYGQDALNSLLPAAHEAHIVVVAWVYTALDDPAQDAAMTLQVARYTTPDGQQVDGIAADIEEVTTAQAVGTYASTVRAALPGLLFVGVTFPPLYHMDYPYATLAREVDVLAPMDYWHSMPQPYQPSYVYQYVVNSIDTIRQLDHDPSLPIAPIGQAYDMFTSSGTGPNNPTPQEIQAAFAGAEAAGAIGFSLYRWGTATASEWQTFASLTWGSPVPGYPSSAASGG